MVLSERVRVRHVPETDSTNRLVAEAAAAGEPEGLVVVTDHQTAGRGRLGRSWEAPPGTALLVSILLRPAGLPPRRGHLVTSAVGLAAAAACQRVGGFTPELKWPNDLLVGGSKLAGILAERTAGAIVVGLGLNLTAAPAGAATAAGAAGREVGRDALLDAVLDELDPRYGDWEAVAAEYAGRCATVGRRVRVEGPGDRLLVGTAVALDGDGRLVVSPDAGGPAVAVSAADVTHLRPG